jgi:hypothetical protein
MSNHSNTINFMYFVYNQPFVTAIEGAFGGTHLEQHFKDKWYGYDSTTNNDRVMRFMGELGINNKETILQWIENNYNHKS